MYIHTYMYMSLHTIFVVHRYSLMLKCWEADVEKRPCFKAILLDLSEEIIEDYVIESLDCQLPSGKPINMIIY